MSKRFRLECGPFLMEITETATGWIARVDGSGEHVKLHCLDELSAKEACLRAARDISATKRFDCPAGLLNPKWL